MTRRILAAVLAVALALVAAVAVLFYARTADARALAGQQAVSVYVASELVPAGTTAKQAEESGLITKELIAAKAVPNGALTSISERIAGLQATSDIVPGELVVSQRFADQVATDGRLAVPADKLAVSVELPDPAKVGQFLVVGSRITIFDTFNVQEADPKDTTPAGDHIADRHEFTRATRVLLPDVQVLAVGQTTTKPDSTSSDNDTKDGAAQTTTVALVTVAVTQAEAEKLIHGVQTGTLYLALKGAQAKVDLGTGTSDRLLFTGAAQ